MNLSFAEACKVSFSSRSLHHLHAKSSVWHAQVFIVQRTAMSGPPRAKLTHVQCPHCLWHSYMHVRERQKEFILMASVSSDVKHSIHLSSWPNDPFLSSLVFCRVDDKHLEGRDIHVLCLCIKAKPIGPGNGFSCPIWQTKVSSQVYSITCDKKKREFFSFQAIAGTIIVIIIIIIS